MAVQVHGWEGVASEVIGPQTTPDEDTEWTGEEVETGFVLVRMIGDDQLHAVSPDDVAPLDDDEFCGGCGQVGCYGDGRGA